MLETKVLKGQERPGAISHHTSVVWNSTMYLYGGSKASGEENKSLEDDNEEKLQTNFHFDPETKLTEDLGDYHSKQDQFTRNQNV
jgi:hypothetical protein